MIRDEKIAAYELRILVTLSLTIKLEFDRKGFKKSKSKILFDLICDFC